MVTVTDLQFPLFAEAEPKTLDKLAKICELATYEAGQYIYRKNDPAITFFVVKSGRVMDEHALSPSVTASIGSLVVADCFGLSSLLPNSSYRSTMVAREDSQILHVIATDLLALARENKAFGASFYRGMATVFLERLASRTDKLLKLLAAHPELKAVMDA